MDGAGSVAWWGFSPPWSTEEESVGRSEASEEGGVGDSQCSCGRDRHVLLVGAADLRHVLKFMVSSSQTSTHFYILESCLEVYARHMLFLKLFTEPPDQFGLHEKVELFLEIFGNSLVRPQCAEYIKNSATQLIKQVTDLDFSSSCMPILDLSELKFKERDFLEGIFKFWASSHPFPIDQYWDGRVRSYLGGRYDSRQGVFDWDYHMKLADMTKLIDAREYKSWREDGIAFKLRRDALYETPNRTLASGLLYKQGVELQAKRSYWGDIVSSPYISFGIETDNQELLKTEGGKPAKTSTDISEYVLSDFIMALSPSAAPSSAQVSSSLMEGTCLLSLLPLNSIQNISKKSRYHKLFSSVYFSNSMVHNMVGEVERLFADNCVLAIETASFILDINQEKKEQYIDKVSRMAMSLHFKEMAGQADKSKASKGHVLLFRKS